MRNDPLAPPADKRLLSAFLAHFCLQKKARPLDLLKSVTSAFSRLPYENLTKIIKESEFGRTERARREPAVVLSNHFALGTGGTCFSLTATLLHLVRSLGWEAEPILADRGYGENTHCAVLIWVEGGPHLLDPGYLIVDPVPLEGSSVLRIVTAFNQLILSPGAGDRVDLYTIQQCRRTYRLTYKAQPADAGEFLKAWDASFGWDMMRYPLLTRVCGSKQLYLRGNRHQVRFRDGELHAELSREELVDRISSDFGLDHSIVIRALHVLKARGEPYGKAWPR
jgi:arylamine N-acetyltransferase